MNINDMTKSNGRYLLFLTFVSGDPGFFSVAFYEGNHKDINNKGYIFGLNFVFAFFENRTYF